MFTLFFLLCFMIKVYILYIYTMEVVMQITYSHQDKDPIYLQIVKQIKVQIMNGTLHPNQPLPSMRALASELRISVITSKRAYEELLKQKGKYYQLYTGKFELS